MRSATVILLVTLAACGGCATFGGGRITSSTAWQSRGGAAGKVLLIVSGTPSRQLSAGELVRAAASAVDHQPHTTVINPNDFADHLSPDLTEAQALEMARKRGADSVCLINMASYGSSFTIDLSPIIWRMSESTMFSLRIIDVPTGNLLAHSDSVRTVMYPYSVIPPNLPKAFEERVEWALRPIPAY